LILELSCARCRCIRSAVLAWPPNESVLDGARLPRPLLSRLSARTAAWLSPDCAPALARLDVLVSFPFVSYLAPFWVAPPLAASPPLHITSAHPSLRVLHSLSLRAVSRHLWRPPSSCPYTLLVFLFLFPLNSSPLDCRPTSPCVVMDASDPRVVESVRSQFYQSMVGRQWVVRHLKSVRGAQLNGRRGMVVAADTTAPGGPRLLVRIDGEQAAIRLKAVNLAEPGSFTDAPSLSRVPPDRLVFLLRRVVAEKAEEVSAEGMERPDMVARLAHWRKHLDEQRLPPPVACMDPLLSAAEVAAAPLLTCMTQLRPCCTGDGTADAARFGEGLYGAGDVCAVCLSDLPFGLPVTGLPCGHVFHKACAADALAVRHACPSCARVPPPALNGGDFTVDSADQLLVRLKEWVVSGMCERCQARYQEADPLIAVPNASGVAQLVAQSQLTGQALG